ncbi:MAG: hypothetical protein V4550_13080 [Gemmatimonadota bacterium]
MNRDTLRLLSLALLCSSLSACRGAQTHFTESAPSPQAEFVTMLTQASDEAIAGRHAAADRLLADYTTRFPASADAVEAMYWRALYKVDPANQSASPREAIVLLDGYLMSSTAAHRSEAVTLKRLAAALDARVAPQPAGPVRVDPAPPGDKAKDDEIARLKDELAKANAELERIKRRLAQPTKP